MLMCFIGSVYLLLIFVITGKAHGFLERVQFAFVLCFSLLILSKELVNVDKSVDMVVKLDDILSYCNAQIPYLVAHSESAALATLIIIKKFCLDNSFVLGDEFPCSCGGDIFD